MLLCGGGLNGASAFMWAMAWESIPSDRRSVSGPSCGPVSNMHSNRSNGFYYIFSAFYLAELLGSFIASVTIDISPWIPCGLATGSVTLCLILLLFMPDLWKFQSHQRPSRPADEDEDGDTLQSTKHRSIDGLVRLLSNKNILLIIPVFLVSDFRYTILSILMQYASVQFGLRISIGATFYTETAIVNVALFLFLVPQTTSHIRQRYQVRSQAIDLFLVRSSVCIMCVGCICIRLAPSSNILPIGEPDIWIESFSGIFSSL